MPLTTGERLGHYEVIALIGSGGMGDVYRARDPRLGRDVAVKTLRSAGTEARRVTNSTLPLLGRLDEAIAAYREVESRPLPGTMRDLMRAYRLVLENRKEESYAIAQTFFDKHFDPEGLYFTARVLARLGEPEASLDLLERIIERGFYCSAIMLRDPWMDSIRGRSRFADVVRRADTRTREAAEEFQRLNGDRILGVNS
jgi:serine/threonine protein kinase